MDAVSKKFNTPNNFIPRAFFTNFSDHSGAFSKGVAPFDITCREFFGSLDSPQFQENHETEKDCTVLPGEIMDYIFSFLNAKDLLTCTQVSRYIRQIACSNQLWKPLVVETFGDWEVFSFFLFQKSVREIADEVTNENFSWFCCFQRFFFCKGYKQLERIMININIGLDKCGDKLHKIPEAQNGVVEALKLLRKDERVEKLNLENTAKFSTACLKQYCEIENIKVDGLLREDYIRAITRFYSTSDFDSDVDELDLDHLYDCSLEILKVYCYEEGLKINGTTKADYINAIEVYNHEES